MLVGFISKWCLWVNKPKGQAIVNVMFSFNLKPTVVQALHWACVRFLVICTLFWWSHQPQKNWTYCKYFLTFNLFLLHFVMWSSVEMMVFLFSKILCTPCGPMWFWTVQTQYIPIHLEKINIREDVLHTLGGLSCGVEPPMGQILCLFLPCYLPSLASKYVEEVFEKRNWKYRFAYPGLFQCSQCVK